MNGLDWVLLVLVLAYAVSGYWQGFIAGAFATVGLLAGGLVGVLLAPVLLGNAEPSVWVSLGALLVVLVAASFGQAAAQFLGAKVRSAITWQPARALDAVGGAALSVVAVLVISWALGVAISGARLPLLTGQVRNSEVLGAVDSVMPPRAVQALNSFNDVVGTSVFPRYLEPFANERISDVPAAPRRISSDPEIAAASASVLKVRGENRCGRGVEGTGFLFQPDRLMTNAHVVAGVRAPIVVTDRGPVPARVVYYNAQIDVAVLAVDDLGRPFLSFDTDGNRRQAGAVLGYPQDGPYNVQGARIRDRQRLRSQDIYGNGTVIRDVYSLRALVRPGNSGGPLVDRDGEVLGVVFAASVSDEDTGYALTADQVAQAAALGATATTPVATGDCA